MLELKDLRFSYGERPVLAGVDLRVEPGELVFLLGANGAGKTTLFRCILGLLPGYTGQILLDGAPVSGLSPRALAGKIAYIPQAYHPVFPYTVLDMVLMGANHRIGVFSAPGQRERELAMDALSQLGMADAAGRSFQQLSGGEQQLVLIARALTQQARILLMDEPTSSLDFGNQVRVLERISALAWQGYTVLLSCHNPQHAMLYAQRVIALHDGRVAADGPPASALSPELIRMLYHVPARFVETDDGVLIAPVRRSMFRWTPDMIRFMCDADARNGAAGALAELLSRELPQGTVCDAGCGVGGLALALAGRFRQVVAADLSAEALAALAARNPHANLTVRRCDVLADRPETPYDAMVFCFFGGAGEILSAARRQCRGTVAVIKKKSARHSFSLTPKPRKSRRGFDALAQEMEARGIPFRTRDAVLDMGQPFRSLADAVLFFRIYSRDDDPASITEEAVKSRLEPRDDPEFPWYLPAREPVGLLFFEVADVPESASKEGEDDP